MSFAISAVTMFCGHHDSGGAVTEINQLPARSDGIPKHLPTDCMIAPRSTPPCQPLRGTWHGGYQTEARQCLDSRTTTTPVGSGSCGLRLVRVSSLQLARLTISPA